MTVMTCYRPIKLNYSELYLVDYINNNLSKCFNSWVSKTKDFQVVEMHDKIRQMIIKKMVLRAKIARKMSGKIIPAVTNALNAKTKTIKDP